MAIPNVTSIIQTAVGASSVNNQVIPFMRSREVEFTAENLRPGRQAQFFFGDTNVTRFTQRASRLLPDNANSNHSMVVVVGERLYCNTTHGFASVIGGSMGNTIYINENYITVNVSAIGANTLGINDYPVGSIVYQGTLAANNTPDTAVFEGQVVYWNNTDKVMVLEPLFGSLTQNGTSTSNVLSWLFQSGVNKVISANNIVTGSVFPLNGQVSSLDNVANRFLVGTYDHRMGVVSNAVTPPNANCVIVTGTPPSDAVGNLFYICAETGLGQAGQVLTISGNIVYTNTTFIPYPGGNSYYSFGPNYVDSASRIFGVFNIPETTTVQFPTGAQTFSISDSPIVDDPNSTMGAKATYIAAGYLGAGTSTPATPIVTPSTLTSTSTSGVSASNPTSMVSTSQTVVGSPGPNTTYAGVLSQLAANAAANGIYNGIDLSKISQFSVNPIAQTFYTPKPTNQNTNFGIFVSSVNIWFNAVPEGSSPQFPVQLSIVEVVNGVPTTNVIASSSVDYSQIQVNPNTPDSVNIGSLIKNNQTVTTFTFSDPVYLAPSTQYALTLYTESPDYEVWISQIGATDESSGGANKTRRISSQPSVGSFFKSQNSSAWTPIPNQMLMFVLNKAQFSTSPVSFTFNMNPIGNLKAYDKLLLHCSDLTFSPCELTYKVQTVLANTFAPDGSYTQVTPDSPLNFGHDLSISSLNSTRRRLIFPGNNQSLVCQVSMQTQNPDLTPVINGETLSAIIYTNVINSGQINQELITITNPGNHINAANIVVTISPPDLADGTQATANVMALVGNQIPTISVTNPGNGYSLAPTITISEPGAPANATAYITGENSSTGGNAIARYITRPVKLANGFSAGDLRVYLSTIVPKGTDVLVYYKVLGITDSQPFANVPWVQMSIVNPNNSPDQLTPINLQYCPSLGPNGLPNGTLSYTLNGVQYPLGGTFQQFAIKIVLLADDTTVPPIVNSMACVAYPGG